METRFQTDIIDQWRKNRLYSKGAGPLDESVWKKKKNGSLADTNHRINSRWIT